MIDLFTKLDKYIDYNNSYSLKKALNTLYREFGLAKTMVDKKIVLDATKKFYDKLSRTYRESQDYGETMAYFQKVIAQKLRDLISYMIKSIGIANEIE